MSESHSSKSQNRVTKIELILQEIGEIKADVRDMKAESQNDRKEFWKAINELKESITGNSREGLVVRIDRNTQFRRNLSKLLWALFTPLYGGLIVMLVKLVLDTFGK